MVEPPAPRLLTWTQRRPLLVDALIAAGLLLFFVVATVGTPTDAGLTITAIAPLALRRRFPEATFALISLACLAQVVLTADIAFSGVGFLFALYALVAYSRSPRIRTAGLVVGLLGSVIGPLRWSLPEAAPYAQIFGIVLTGTMTATTWISGDLVRRRRQVSAALAEQNAALRRDQQQRELLAAQGERARIAREMHDVVAHNLSVIVVQADGAAYAVRHGSGDDGRRTATAVEALEVIARTARAALAETRRLVGVLHEQGQRTEYAPLAGLEDIPGLVASVRDSGLDVEFVSLPAPRVHLAQGGELAAYRVVQESLTNVIKHAGPQARARITLSHNEGGVLIDVRDDGRGAAARSNSPAGHGLVGMRERIAAVGGTLTCGPVVTGGYAVRAWLPGEVEHPATTAGAPSVPLPDARQAPDE